MFQPAVDSGIAADRYWDMTYLDVVAQIKANRKQRIAAIREQAVLDHTQANLIAFAFNDPQHMPSLHKAYPFLEELNATAPGKVMIESTPETKAWQNDQAMLLQQAMKVRETIVRKNQRGGNN